MNRNRYNALFGEKVTLYAFFYKEYNGEIVLKEPSSIEYVQFFGPEDNQLGVGTIPELETIQVGIAGIPGDKISSVSPGVKKVTITVPDYDSYDEQTEFSDKWVGPVNEFGDGIDDWEHVFYVSPKRYDISPTQPETIIDLSVSVDITEMKKGERGWLKFDITDANDFLTYIDEATLTLATSSNEVIKSNISVIPESLFLHYYLNTSTLQSYIDSNYKSSSLYASYPLKPILTSDNLTNYDFSDDSKLLYFYNASYRDLTTYRFPSSLDDIHLDPNRIETIKIESSNLSGYNSSNETVSLYLKENDGDYTKFTLPEDMYELSGETVAKRIAISLKDQKDSLENKDDLYYSFSNVGTKFVVVGGDETESLTIKNEITPIYTPELDGDFLLQPREIKVFNESVLSGFSVISATLDDYSSLEYTTTIIQDEATSNVTTNTFSILGAGTGESSVQTKSTEIETWSSTITKEVISSSITQNVLISISEDLGEYITYSLPYVPKGQTDKAAYIASYIDSQAVTLRQASKITYSFTHSDDNRLVLDCPQGIRQITLKDLDNDAYDNLGGGFSVEEGEGNSLNIKAPIQVPQISTDALTYYSSLTEHSLLNIAENENDYIQYRLPTNQSNMSLGNLANYVQDLRESYGTSLHYDFSTSVSGDFQIVGEALYCEKLKLKYDKPEVYAGDYLKNEFSVVQGDYKRYDTTPVRITDSDISYTFASHLEIQRATYNDTDVSFLHSGGNFIVNAKTTAASIIVTTASYLFSPLVSDSLADFTTLTFSNLLAIQENDNDTIQYTVYSFSSSLTPEENASRLASSLESQRTSNSTETKYNFYYSGSKLYLGGDPLYTSMLTVRKDIVNGSYVNAQIGGSFLAGGSTVSYYNAITALPSTINDKLGGDFDTTTPSAMTFYKSELSADNFTTTTKPLDAEDSYKWIVNVTTNDRLLILETDFSFTE